jgi:hypothetical protein
VRPRTFAVVEVPAGDGGGFGAECAAQLVAVLLIGGVDGAGHDEERRLAAQRARAHRAAACACGRRGAPPADAPLCVCVRGA